jgi:hypothetical protein
LLHQVSETSLTKTFAVTVQQIGAQPVNRDLQNKLHARFGLRVGTGQISGSEQR